MAVDKVSFFDNLTDLTFANDLSLNRPHQKEAVRYALREPNRDGRGIHRNGQERGDHHDDRNASGWLTKMEKCFQRIGIGWSHLPRSNCLRLSSRRINILRNEY
jgi:hypothetical protein